MTAEKIPTLDEWFEYCDVADVFQISRTSDLDLLTCLADSAIRLESSLADNVVLSPQIISLLKTVTAGMHKSTELMQKRTPRKSRDGHCGFCDRIIPDSGESECRYKMWLYSTDICQPCYVGIFCDDSLSEFHRFLNIPQIYWGHVTDYMTRYLGGMST